MTYDTFETDIEQTKRCVAYELEPMVQDLEKLEDLLAAIPGGYGTHPNIVEQMKRIWERYT